MESEACLYPYLSVGGIQFCLSVFFIVRMKRGKDGTFLEAIYNIISGSGMKDLYKSGTHK